MIRPTPLGSIASTLSSRNLLVFLLWVLLGTAGCAMGGSAAEPPAESVFAAADATPSDAMQSEPRASTAGVPAAPPARQAKSAPEAAVEENSGGPLLIYRAELHLASYQIEEAIDDVQRIAVELGGHLEQRDDTTITIRVPAPRFQEALSALEGVGQLIHQAVSTEDVTDQVRDLSVRLSNARAMRERLEHLLERAHKVEDALQIEKELQRITLEIERLTGTLDHLQDRIRFSAITARFEPRAAASVQHGKWRLPFPWLNELGLPALLDLHDAGDTATAPDASFH